MKKQLKAKLRGILKTSLNSSKNVILKDQKKKSKDTLLDYRRLQNQEYPM